MLQTLNYLMNLKNFNVIRVFYRLEERFQHELKTTPARMNGCSRCFGYGSQHECHLSFDILCKTYCGLILTNRLKYQRLLQYKLIENKTNLKK